MRLKIFIWIVIFFFGELNILFAQEFFTQNYENNIVDISVSEKKVVFYNLVGSTQDLKKTDIKISLPEGFKLLTNTSTIDSLKIGELKKLFFTISVDPNTPFGSYSLEIQLINKEQVIAKYDLFLNLKKNRSLEVIPIEKPDKLSQKSQEEIKYLVKNTGNTPEKISISSRSGVVSGKTNILLLAGESTVVSTINDLPLSNQDIKLVSFDLSCKLDDLEKPFVTVFTVPMMSFTTAKNDPYQRFPVQSSLVYNQFNSSSENMGAFFFDINGKGFLDSKNKHLVEFIARGPNRFNIPRFGSIDQYFVGYETGNWRVDLGDKMFKNSELTESSRFAKGAQIKRKIGDNEISAFYLKPRFIKTIKNEFGANLTHTFSDNFKSELIYMHKYHTENDTDYSTNFLAFVSNLVKNRYNAKMEMSLSKTGNLVSAGAFYNSNFELEKFKMYTNIIFTGKNYFGFYNNSLQLSNSTFYNLNKKITLGFSKNISQLNPSLDSFYYTVSPFVNNNNFSVNLDINKKNKVRFFLISGSREDKMKIQSYHYKEQLFRYFYEYNSKAFNFRLDGDLGKSLNLLETTDNQKYNDFYRFRGLVGYKATKNFSASVFMENLNTTRYAAVTSNKIFWYYGVSTQMRIKNMLSFNLNYRNNYTPDELYQSQSFFDASLNLRVKNQELSLMGSYGIIPPPINDKNLFVSLKYTVNINTPIRKKRGLGGVNGRIDGVKKVGVVLNMNGKSVMTDKDGRFSFNDLVPGKYFLGVNKSTLGFGNILDANMPYLVEVKPNERREVKLDVINTGKVLGEVVMVKSEPSSIENILVELYNDTYSKITTTNKQGGFQFSELREGEYKIRVVSENIKKQFTINNTSLNLKVQKGSDTLFTFEIEEKKRKVNFQKERIILSDI